ncbi:MAG: hypothetical protein NVS4B8_04290 [Herpetosiphon sp.]
MWYYNGMFNIGFEKLIVILIVAVIVVGPERLPEFARKLGQMISDARRVYDNLRQDLGPDFEEVEKQIRTLRSLDPRREMASAGRRIVEGITTEVPELADAQHHTIGSELSRMQSEITGMPYPVPSNGTSTAASVQAVAANDRGEQQLLEQLVVSNAGPSVQAVPAVDTGALQQQVKRLGHDVLSDGALDRPVAAEEASGFER